MAIRKLDDGREVDTSDQEILQLEDGRWIDLTVVANETGTHKVSDRLIVKTLGEGTWCVVEMEEDHKALSLYQIGHDGECEYNDWVSVPTNLVADLLRANGWNVTPPEDLTDD
jgi:hypothetical protein